MDCNDEHASRLDAAARAERAHADTIPPETWRDGAGVDAMARKVARLQSEVASLRADFDSVRWSAHWISGAIEAAEALGDTKALGRLAQLPPHDYVAAGLITSVAAGSWVCIDVPRNVEASLVAWFVSAYGDDAGGPVLVEDMLLGTYNVNAGLRHGVPANAMHTLGSRIVLHPAVNVTVRVRNAGAGYRQVVPVLLMQRV